PRAAGWNGHSWSSRRSRASIHLPRAYSPSESMPLAARVRLLGFSLARRLNGSRCLDQGRLWDGGVTSSMARGEPAPPVLALAFSLLLANAAPAADDDAGAGACLRYDPGRGDSGRCTTAADVPGTG